MTSFFHTSCVKYGKNIHVRGYRNGQRFSEKIQFKPTFYVPSKEHHNITNLDGDSLSPIHFDDMPDALKFIRENQNIPGMKIFGNENFTAQYLYQLYGNKEIDYNYDKIKILSFDIESDSSDGFGTIENADKEITAINIIGVQGKNIEKYQLGYYEDYVPAEDVKYTCCKNEKELLLKFLEIYEYIDPDVLTGYFIDGYDVPYTYRRITNVFNKKTADRLSPHGIVQQRNNGRFDFGGQKEDIAYNIQGVEILDFMDLYKAFGKTEPLENFRLDTVAEFELGKKKLSYAEYGSLNTLYVQNPQKFLDYNARDNELVVELEQKLHLIEMMVRVAYRAKSHYLCAIKQTNLWDDMIYHRLMSRNTIVPLRKVSSKTEKFRGAFVKTPVPGLYNWVMFFDATALYPRTIMTYNCGPDTLLRDRMDFDIEDLISQKVKVPHSDKFCMAPNGSYFSKDKKSFIAELIEEAIDDRSVFKKKQLDEDSLYQQDKKSERKVLVQYYKMMQNALKIIANSLYGVLGSEFFRFYDIAIAEAVTYGGQLSNRFVMGKINELLNKLMDTGNKDYVIMGDTDSIGINLEPIIEKFCAGKTTEQKIEYMLKIDKEILEPYIARQLDHLGNYMNCYEKKLEYKREVICEKMMAVAKKNYACSVWVNEKVRYARPKIKITGLKAVRSDTPDLCRKRIKNIIRLILTKDESSIQTYVKLFRERFFNSDFNDIAKPVGVKHISDYMDKDGNYIKGTPVNTRAAVLFNREIYRKELQKKYEPIREGDKVKWAYLISPNPIGENVIGCKIFIPPEFNVTEYIDYEKQFEVVFQKPVRDLLDVIGWNIQKTNKLTFF